MRSARPLVLLCGLVLAVGAARAGVTGYYRFPTIHGDTVVFAAEGDLWQVSTAGGTAVRLTTHPGNEGFPKFSPDGEWLAFSAEYHGNVDVYVMPAGGGEPLRLTYHPAADEVVAWRPDSGAVVFRSYRASAHREYRLFEVPRTGGHPRLVPVGVAALAALAPDGRTIAFNRFSREFRTWKRYLGGTAQDIWVGDLVLGTFRKITDWPGTDAFPMWHAGRVCFASDRHGRMNLYSAAPDGSDVRQLTQHQEYDVRWPDLHAGRIVYMHGGDLWLLDLPSGHGRRLEITLPTDRVLRRPRPADATDTLEDYGLSPDGRRLVISARGELWVAPTRPGRVIPLTQSSGIRERAGVFAPDGRSVAGITDESGEQELVLFDAAGKESRRLLTQRGKGWLFPPAWSPDGKRLAYADLTQALFVVDLEGGEIRPVDTSDVWEITEYAFSPDGKWLAYTRFERNRYRSIYLYELASGQTHAVTTPFSDDCEPTWDPQGRYLYFLSKRGINPVLDEFDLEHVTIRASRPCVLILAADGKSPLLPHELLEADEQDDEDDEDADSPERGAAGAKPGADARPKLPDVRVDLAGIQQRVVELPVPADSYSDLRAVKGKLLYLSTPPRGLLEDPWPEEDKKPRSRLHVYDFEDREADVLVEALRDYTLSADGKRIAFRVGDEILVADLDTLGEPEEVEEKLDPGNLPLLVDPAAEWSQIFTEAWRLQRDFYWAENMAGIDWPAERERYAVLLPRISTRPELNDLIGQLIGELGTSHTYVWGGDAREAESLDVGLLGADLEPDPASGAHRFARILRAEPWETDSPSPLTMSHANVQEGDYLFAINGRPVAASDNVYARLAGLAGREVLLTVGRQPDRSDARDVQIPTLKSESKLRYRDWCRRNREYVAQISQGRIGYLHLPDMGGDGLVEFIKDFYPQVDSDGLVIDVRYNGGGFVSQMILARLARRVVGYDRPRRGAVETYPQRVHAGHKVVLVNQQAGSDGDIFPAAFQMLGLGPVIGMRTWGGVIGIRGDKRFIDGGLSTQPEYAWWDARRGWDLENRGVEPDIEVDILPQDYVAGRDPQLDRALAELERMRAAEPIARPQPPPIPDKSRAGPP